MKPHRLYKFGSFSLDATARVLLRDGEPVALTRKSVETLLALVEHAGQVVPREELFRLIWPDRVVDEANLTQNIAMVRRALAAERGTPAWIETFSGRGYRLTGPVIIEEQESVTFTAAPEVSPAPSAPTSETAASPARRASVRWLALLGAGLVVLVAVGWMIRWMNNRRASAGFRVTPFTRLSGAERQPVVSTDGKKVAFLWERDDGQPPSVCVQTAGASSHQQITRDQGHYSSPAWSPDGRALAVLRIDPSATEVLILSPETGEARLVTSFTPPNYGLERRLLDWSPDGQWLAVSHPVRPNKPNGLFLVTVATGEKRLLTEPPLMVGGDIEPRFSPDNRSLAFIRYIHRSHQELYSIPLTGGEPHQLTDDGKQISSHDWRQDSSQIIFASDRSGEFRLWQIRAQATKPEKNPQPVGIYGEFPMEISLARQAQTLVYSIQPEDRNIWRLDLKEKKWTRLIASSAQDASPQYSPKGDQICFRSNRSGEDHLWVSDAEGNNQTQITTESLFPSVGHWSPDGRQIAFNNARTGELCLASYNETDRRWSVRRTGITGIHPVFSPDGKWLYAGTPQSLVRIAAATGQESILALTGGFSLGLSADGQRLCFVRELNETSLWQVMTETGEVSKAVEGLIPGCTSCWALTGQGIYHLGGASHSFDAQSIYYYDFTTRQKREIIKYPEPLAPLGSGPFSLSPDQRYLLCVRIDPSGSDIMRVEPFE
ncbi:MAG TPA: winged helix-turn-helix domain-containing protein [Blastocatellia bacterium]|nr:winged helix-turn-helix domain-containing protein [Blastocatellia bacterium]